MLAASCLPVGRGCPVSNQFEFGFCEGMRKPVTQWTWYTKGGFKLLEVGRTSYEAWLAFFTPLSRGARV